MDARTHARTHTDPHTHTNTQTHIHTPVAYQGNQGNETEEHVFKKRKVFKEDLKELTEVERQTETVIRIFHCYFIVCYYILGVHQLTDWLSLVYLP